MRKITYEHNYTKELTTHFIHESLYERILSTILDENHAIVSVDGVSEEDIEILNGITVANYG